MIAHFTTFHSETVLVSDLTKRGLVSSQSNSISGSVENFTTLMYGEVNSKVALPMTDPSERVKASEVE